jgi:hypothetical protein
MAGDIPWFIEYAQMRAEATAGPGYCAPIMTNATRRGFAVRFDQPPTSPITIGTGPSEVILARPIFACPVTTRRIFDIGRSLTVIAHCPSSLGNTRGNPNAFSTAMEVFDPA